MEKTGKLLPNLLHAIQLKKIYSLEMIFLHWWFSEVFYTFTSVRVSSLETLNIKQSFVRMMLSRAFQWSKAKCIRTNKKYGKLVQSEFYSLNWRNETILLPIIRNLFYAGSIIEGLYYPVFNGRDDFKNKWTPFGEFSLKRFRATLI